MVCSFNKQPILQPVVEKNLLQLVVNWMCLINGMPFWIVALYTYNGASIPRLFWLLIGSPFDPRFWAAALIHDYLYLTHLLPRAVADEIFFQFLMRCGVSKTKARIMWLAVRSPAGALAWKNNKQDRADLGQVMLLSGRWDKTYGYIPDQNR